MKECLELTRVCAPQNSPNDLQMLSDAPAHHLFCLLPPVPPTQNALPEVLAVVQVQRREKHAVALVWGAFGHSCGQGSCWGLTWI